MKAASLNVVQKLFQSWETVHPYNAAQAVKLRGRMAEDDVRRAWELASGALHLVTGRINGHTQSEIPARAPSDTSTTLLTPSDALDEHLSFELNRTFASDVDGHPFRPFLLRDGENTWIGLTYRHCVADSVSIRMLMRDWLASLAGDSTSRIEPLTHTNGSYWKLFTGRNAKVQLDQTVSTFIRGHHRLRSAQKPVTSGAGDYPVRVMLGRCPMV